MSLLPSEINSISLRLINITYNLALSGLLAGSAMYSSNNWIFLEICGLAEIVNQSLEWGTYSSYQGKI